MQPSPGGRSEQKIACLSRIARAKLPEIQGFALFNCVETYLQLSPEETAAFERLRSLETNKEVRVMELTWADRMRAEGRKEGKKEGRAEGREKGREEGARLLLARLLEQRFGDLPVTARRRLAAVRSLERLNRLAEQVLSARSLDELGLA
jgi:flagellar biosynthesis/type III secretory pathway protein FliH